MGNPTTTRVTDEPEFPGFANVFESTGEAEPIDADPAAAALNRRSFLALSTATALAAAVGCRRPDLQILPYSAIPDDQVGHIAPGRPTFYATAIPRPGGALPVLVESHDGRPTKIEGNPKHPASRGIDRRLRPGLDPRSLQPRSRDVGQVPRRHGTRRPTPPGPTSTATPALSLIASRKPRARGSTSSRIRHPRRPCGSFASTSRRRCPRRRGTPTSRSTTTRRSRARRSRSGTS